MTKNVIIISLVAIAAMTSCEAVKNCCKDKCKTEKSTEGSCNKCGKTSCSSSCDSKTTPDNLKAQ
ncbi:MAG: hypothetical protein WED10_02925 [Brumimicrobium sp.]